MVDSLTTRKYPFVEEIDGRVYFNLPKNPKSSALDIGLLALSHAHPGRLSAQEVIEVVKRHKFKPANAAVAVQRLKPFVDEDDHGGLKLRPPGMQNADQIRKRISPKRRLMFPSCGCSMASGTPRGLIVHLAYLAAGFIRARNAPRSA